MKIYEHRLNPFGSRVPGGHVVCLANGIVMPIDDEPLPGFERVPLYLRAELAWELRSLLDRWIDSGRDYVNNDEPLKRDVYWQSAEGLEPLANVLWAWNLRHAPDIAFQRSGERGITMGKPKRKKDSPFELASFLFGDNEPLPETEHEAHEIAIYWLQELLESSDRYRIARCDNPECRRRYYMRERIRKGLIKNGTYCRNCMNAGSSARVKASLERRKQKIIECAASVWNAFKPSHQYSKKSEWVAVQVNRRLHLDRPIKSKWITQNQKAIEAEIERRKRVTV